jgi:hypothetical protein
MRRLHSLLRLTWRERLLWLQALFVIGVVRLALWGLPFLGVQAALSKWGQRSRRSGSTAFGVPRVGQMVASASRYVPGATCLVQALAAQFLLAREGIFTELKIGVLKNAGSLHGHAWLELEGKPVFGGTAAMLSAFARLKKEHETH